MDQALLLSFAELEEVHWWFVARRLIVMDTVRRWAPDGLARIAEVGCGTGGTLRTLSAAFPSASVLGIDPNEQALALTRDRGSEAVLGRFEELPLPDGWADLLLGLDVIEHVRDDARALAEARRALRPGGRLVLTVPAWLWSKPSRRWEYALAALVAIGVFAGSFYGYDALRNGGVVAPAAISVDGKAVTRRRRTSRRTAGKRTCSWWRRRRRSRNGARFF